MRSVALVGGKPETRDRTASTLHAHAYAIGAPCETGASFLATSRSPRCAIVDVDLPDMTGGQLLAELHRARLTTAVVFEVSPDQLELAVNLMRAGAADVVVRDADPEALLRSLERVFERDVTIDARQAFARSRLEVLSHRELEVVLLATAGLGNKDVGTRLQISFRTVELHRRHAMRKLGTANIVELTHLVRSAGRDEPLPEGSNGAEPLTHRERQVQTLTDEGLCTKDIAQRLSISVRTVETYRANVLRKLHFGGLAPDLEKEVQLLLWPHAEPIHEGRELRQRLHLVS